MGAPQPPRPPPPGSGNNLSVPLHRSPSPAAAIAATTMPKRKKQNQQQQLTLDPQVPKREEIGDEDDEIPTGPPSLPGPPPMANGKPGDPKSALHRGPPGSRGLMIPPLLTLPPPLRGRGPVWGDFAPRGGFHKEQRQPRRLKSWSLVKNTCPPKNEPQITEDKSDRPVCRHFAKKGHCRYEDLCAFYHPGVNGPPL
ncbi:proline-rich protein 3 isoform 4-T4 [Glossophaga mutica]